MSNNTPINREIAADFNDGFQEWRPLDLQKTLASTTPACYELAVGTSVDDIKAVTYGGATLEEVQRAKEYAAGGSHKKHLFEEARDAGLKVFVRTKLFATREEAFIYEQRMLDTFEYGWNKKDQRTGERPLKEILEAAERTKKSRVVREVRPEQRYDAIKVKRNINALVEADQRENYNGRLEKAEKNPASLDRLKPRFLVFKKGVTYDVTKPLAEQLDMRNKLNQLYVRRALSVDPSRLEPHEKSASISRSNSVSASEPATAPAPVAKEPRLTKAGKPDMRCKENKASPPVAKLSMSSAMLSSSSSTSTSTSTNPAPVSGPVKKNGEPDMRYKANKVPTASYVAPSTSTSSSSSSGPLKRNGEPDMRYAVNRQTSSYTSSYGGGSRSAGPLTKSGRPDMRYSANKRK